MPIRKYHGFTLIELMVAISIVAVMSAVGIVMYSTAQKSGRISKRIQDLTAINTAIELFRSSTGKYPIAATPGSFGCIKALTGVNALAPTYMPFVPDDPSGYCYKYTSDAAGNEYKIKTDNTIPTSEMTFADFNKLDSKLDPAKDGNIGSGATACIVDPLTENVTGQGWAFYTNNPTTCLY
jgi:prepilin-type N-terminal cleavage/methylation domain-containing protein